MHRCETGREGRALNTVVSNQPESAAKGAAFASARAAALRVMGADALRGAVFLEGGLAPWLASGRDSGRLHGDVDFSVRLRDMPAVREWLAGEGLYDRALDSLDLACNASRADFGVHAIVGGVPVSFCPFSFDGGALIQRNAALRRFEGFDALFEARIPGIAEEDFVETRRLPSVGAVGFSTLEACRAAKGTSGRPKDAADIGEIDRIGVDCVSQDMFLGIRSFFLSGFTFSGKCAESVLSFRFSHHEGFLEPSALAAELRKAAMVHDPVDRRRGEVRIS